MPPKKKKGTAVIDGVDTSSMTRDQLEKFSHNLKNEVEKEREERNYFQNERDQLRTFWEITKNQLEDAKLEILAKQRQVEQAEEQAELDVKHIAQQMKHLQYENQNRIAEIRAENMTQLKLAQEDHGLQELELLNDKRELRRLLREKDEMTELQIQQLKMEQSEEMSKERDHFQQQIRKMIELYEKRLEQYICSSETKHKMEMDEIDERKSNQIMKLIKEHEESLADIRNYYTDIVQNNLTLIGSLKEQMEVLSSQLEKSEHQLKKVTAENRKLAKQDSQIELADLRKKLEHLNKDRSALSRIRLQSAASTKQLNATKWEVEALRMRCDTITTERDELKKRFGEIMIEMQQKTGLKNVLLERKLAQLKKEYERLEMVFGEVLKVTGLEPQDLCTKVENYLRKKNERIEQLEYELARVAKCYSNLLESYEMQLEKSGISKESHEFHSIRCIAPILFKVDSREIAAPTPTS
ncbi:dynein regulatory complex subunit 4 [Contarinia nasturtii]|uniref:dynein regulatory complex subunit 4 n=1 Tax=Contarinia nasturtii TaxID=265458 RepID=UPI0012D47ABE|nr:dynein regulatory complex subunit 4 [Contarinia nasturtii]